VFALWLKLSQIAMMTSMFKMRTEPAPTEEIIFDCPACGVQLMAIIPKRKVIIQCGECDAQCSVQAAKGARSALKKAAKEEAVKKKADPNYEAPPLAPESLLQVKEVVKDIGSTEGKDDLVRAVSLKPGGKAALERARNARGRGRGVPSPASKPPNTFANPGGLSVDLKRPSLERRHSSRLANRDSAAPYSRRSSASTGLTPMMQNSRLSGQSGQSAFS